MCKSTEDEIHIKAVNSILEELKTAKEIYDDQHQRDDAYAVVSYSEKNKKEAFEVIEILLRNGVNIRNCNVMDSQDVYSAVSAPGCKCVITLISEEYIYDFKCLLHQYARFRKSGSSNDEEMQRVPCLVIDLYNNRCKYKDDINDKEISTLKSTSLEDENKITSQDEEYLKKGLENLYDYNDGNFAKLIARQIEAIVEKDYDEIRRQMSFILDYDGHLDNVTNFSDIKIFAGNTVKKLSNQGVYVLDKIKEKCGNHFDEWGKNVYFLNISEDSNEKYKARIVCSIDNELYIKKGSCIIENPKPERSENEKVMGFYRKYILNGVMKPSAEIDKLVTAENIKNEMENEEEKKVVMTIDEVTLFVNGEKKEACGEVWTNEKTGKTYAEDLAERGNV